MPPLGNVGASETTFPAVVESRSSEGNLSLVAEFLLSRPGGLNGRNKKKVMICRKFLADSPQIAAEVQMLIVKRLLTDSFSPLEVDFESETFPERLWTL